MKRVIGYTLLAIFFIFYVYVIYYNIDRNGLLSFLIGLAYCLSFVAFLILIVYLIFYK